MFPVGEIVWGHMRGFPWWPGRVVQPTPDQLKRFSLERTPPDQRLIWFFNDSDRYSLMNTKNLVPFSDERATAQSQKKANARLKVAFKQASAEYHRSVNLETDEPVDALEVAPPDSRYAVLHSRNSKKRKPSDLNDRPPVSHEATQVHNTKKRRGVRSKYAKPLESKPASDIRITQVSTRLLADAESDKLSTHGIPSPCDRSSQETGSDSRPNAPALQHVPTRSNPLRLRIREKQALKSPVEIKKEARPIASSTKRRPKRRGAHSTSDEEQPHKKHPLRSSLTRPHSSQPMNHSADGVASTVIRATRRNQAIQVNGASKSRTSHLPPKLRHFEMYKRENAEKRELPVGNKGDTDITEPETEIVSGLARRRASGILCDNNNIKSRASPAKRDVATTEPSTTVNGIIESEGVRLLDMPLRRSGRMRKVTSKMIDIEEGGKRENEDVAKQQAGSKRSKGVEAPRKSDGQRRPDIRQEMDESDLEDGQDDKRDGQTGGRDSGNKVKAKREYDALNEAARPLRDLSKEECIQVILRLQDALRQKRVELWLQGRRLVESRKVVRTEEEMVRVCESGVETVEDLLRWAKMHRKYDKGKGSRFVKMEERALEECAALGNIYFDRRRVNLDRLARRVLKLAKEMPPYSRQVTNALQDVLVMWLDLTSGSRQPNR